MTKISFRPLADAEFTEAAQWYEDQRQGLGLQYNEPATHFVAIPRYIYPCVFGVFAR